MAGSLAMGNKGGAKTVETRQDTAPWLAQQPYLKDLFSRAQGLYGSVPQQGSPYTLQAAQGLAAGAQNPNSITNQAAGQFGKTIGGDYLSADSNPYLRGAVNDTMNQIQGRVAGTFGTRGGNNYGSSAHQEWLGRSLADAALPIYAQNFQTERGRQLTAAQYGPTADAAGAGQLAQAGALQNQYNASPWDALQRYQQGVTGNFGQQGTATEPYQKPNDLLNALGLGIAAYGAFGSDRRLKRDIERAGTHRIGIPLYRFRYLYDDTPRIGVMADDLEPVMPQAVTRDHRGFQMVRYDLLAVA